MGRKKTKEDFFGLKIAVYFFSISDEVTIFLD